MKVSSCYTVYGFDDIELALKIYTEYLGCKVLHHPAIPENEYYVVEDANGNRTDLVSGPFAKSGFHATRINVDNIEEAVEYFTVNGTKLVRGIFDYPSCKMAILSAGEGIEMIVYEHKK